MGKSEVNAAAHGTTLQKSFGLSRRYPVAGPFLQGIRGWINYYGRFYKSALYPVLRHMNRALVLWARRKYKKLNRHRRRAEHWLGRLARREPRLFTHWRMGILPSVG